MFKAADDWQLTAEQRVAVEHDGGHLLIVAGAGTGKTTTLAARLAYLVAHGTDPARVLLLTFTRRAASELLRRAEQLGGHDAAAATWGGTFHAIANRLLRRHGTALGLPPSFTVIDQADTADLLGLAWTEAAAAAGRTDERRAPKKDVLAAVHSRVTNTNTPLRAVLTKDFPWCTDHLDAIRETFVAYTGRKRAAQVLDYDDLLLCWAALVAIPAVAAVLQSRFDHVLVDEYQDTNPLQADILAGMTGGGARITAVGDDAQAIFAFRNATHRNIIEFPDRFGADVVLLERNHRSTPSILAATNAVIAEARHRHPKTLWSARPDGPRPFLVECDDEGDQSAAVCARLLEHHDRGIPLRRQAVLFRAAHHSDLLELELSARRIPYVKYGGLRFLEAAHVKDLLCMLRIVENPADELAWFRTLQLLDGVGPATARRLSASAPPPPAAVPTTVASAFEALTAALEAARGPGLATEPGAQVAAVRAWLDPVVERRYPRSTARLADLDRLAQAAAAAPSLSRFLVELTLDPPAATGDLAGPPHLDDDVLTLTTIHSAKGGEWDVVHVIHLADGNVPSDMATGDDDAIEEERRLLYVAMTRARDVLYCYAPLRYHHTRTTGDRHGYAQLTRFFTPVVLSLLDRATSRPVRGPDRDDGDDGVPAVHPQLAAVDDRVAALWQ